MKKALITGGAGFIGLYLARNLLENGYQVDLLDNFSRGVKDRDLATVIKNKDVRLLNIDLLDPVSMDSLDKDYDYVYHLAAIVGVSNVLQKPYTVLKDNVQLLFGMVPFLEAQKNLKRFIFFSTSEIYAGTLQHFTLPIPTPFNVLFRQDAELSLLLLPIAHYGSTGILTSCPSCTPFGFHLGPDLPAVD